MCATRHNSKRVKLWRASLWLLGLSATVSLQVCAAQFVQLTAEIQTVRWLDGYAGRPPSVQSKNWQVRCAVGTNTWLIEEALAGITDDAWWYTGSNIVAHTVVLKYPSDRPELFQQNHPEIVVGRGYTKTFNASDGEPVPALALTIGQPGGTEKINLPWLAYCSGKYLKTPERGIPVPSLEEVTLYDEYSERTTCFTDELGLPQDVELYSTNQPLCQYRTVGSTNVLGWNFPLEFHLAQYRRNFRTGIWEVHMTASGRLTAIEPGPEPCIPTEQQRRLER